MSYTEKFALVRTSLLSYCKECITENWDKMFDMWLSCEADLAYGYKNTFKEQFSNYMNSEIEELLFHAGNNVRFAISAFMRYKKNAKLNDVLDFTEIFVSEQLDDFDNWCDDIMMAMYEETSEYERENGDITS